MRITGPSDSKSVGKSKTKKSAAGGFQQALDAASSSEGNASASNVQHVSQTNPLFMLQEVADEPRGKQTYVQEGFDAISYLDKIRLGLICGTILKQDLYELEAIIERWKDKTDDPKLNAILAEIEIRAAVELAKLGVR